ncbi:MAG TPA: queuosine precursor transporter [Patescibacteria group bacterium]|nr:queuosine precursor transporter [Patescibacteria group bacterium]
MKSLQIQRFDFLLALYIACIAISELMGAKTFPIATIGTFHLSASVAIFVVPLIYSVNDIITEVFGKDRARSVVRSGLFMVALFMLFSAFATWLPSTPRFAKINPAYVTVFALSVRIAASSLTAFAVGEFLDVLIFARLRQRFGSKKLWLRTNISNFVSQFLDTTLFMFLAFYSLNVPFLANVSFLFGLILPYWLLKCFMSVIETPLVYLGVTWLKKEEK